MSSSYPDALRRLLEERIVILDGAMGTMIQTHGLAEEDYRGERCAAWASDLKRNNYLLSLTQPWIIRDIHAACLEARADIVETNTFNALATSESSRPLAKNKTLNSQLKIWYRLDL